MLPLMSSKKKKKGHVLGKKSQRKLLLYFTWHHAPLVHSNFHSYTTFICVIVWSTSISHTRMLSWWNHAFASILCPVPKKAHAQSSMYVWYIDFQTCKCVHILPIFLSVYECKQESRIFQGKDKLKFEVHSLRLKKKIVWRYPMSN